MYDLVVLGATPGGLDVASAAARVGARVALIVETRPGVRSASSSLPRLALVEAARLAHRIRSAGSFGIRVASPEIDFAAVMARVRAVVAESEAAASPERLEGQGIKVYHGTPSFEAYDTVLIDGTTRVLAQRFVIATGSRPAPANLPGLLDARPLDESSLTALHERPESLVILGSGTTAVELAQAFARLGTKVAVLAESRHLLPREDTEVSDRLRAILAAEGVAIHTGVAVTQVARHDGRTVCAYRDTHSGAGGEVSGTHVLAATGRLADIEGLNLEAVGIHHADPAHGLEVDEYLQTRSSRVLAIGEVLHRNLDAHPSSREAAVAFQNAVLRLPTKFDDSATPRVTFVDPEIACAGLSEHAAREKHPEVLVFRADLAHLERARIEGKTDGFAKVVSTPSGKVLGATILGAEASLVLQEFVLAMEHGLSLKDLAATSHADPTYAGLTLAIANQFAASRRDGGFVQSAMRWFLGYRSRTEGEAEDGVSGPAAHAEAADHVGSHAH